MSALCRSRSESSRSPSECAGRGGLCRRSHRTQRRSRVVGWATARTARLCPPYSLLEAIGIFENASPRRSGNMNTKHLTTLAVLAAVSIAATAWVLRTSAPTMASDRRGEMVVPSLVAKANDITGLSIRDSIGTLAIERRDNRFVAADSGYPIKTDAVRDVVASSAELSFQEARTSDPARYGDLGLADPGAKDAGKEITFRTAGGELASFVVGNRVARRRQTWRTRARRCAGAAQPRYLQGQPAGDAG